MAKRDSRSATPSCQRPSLRTLLQKTQLTFYLQSTAALCDLRETYTEEVRLHSQLLRLKGLTFEKDEKSAWRKEEDEQQIRLDALFAQLKRQTEAMRVEIEEEKLRRLEEDYARGLRQTAAAGSPPPEQEEESLTYSKDSTPTTTPKPNVSLFFMSPSEAMAARLQEIERKDREARMQARVANEKWLG